MDNAATMNQEIDDEIMSLKDMGIEFPDSYSTFKIFLSLLIPSKNNHFSVVSAYEKSSKEIKNTDTYISKRTSLEFQSSTSEEDSGGGGGVTTTPADKNSVAASSLLTSMQKRSFELTGNDEISDNEVGGAASFGRFRIERRNSKQQNGIFIISEGVRRHFNLILVNKKQLSKSCIRAQLPQQN